MMFANLSAVVGQVRSGALRALAVASPKRSPTAPEIPTLAEQGLNGCEVETWFGIVAPAGTPRAVVGRLNAGLHRVPSVEPFRTRVPADHHAVAVERHQRVFGNRVQQPCFEQW